MRLFLSMVAVATTVTACMPVEECRGDEVLQDDGTCEVPSPIDSDTDVDTDADTDADTDDTNVEGRFSLIDVQWTVAGLPNKNVVALSCDGRELLREDLFTFFTTINREFRVLPDQTCELTLSDVQGGLLPGGQISVCSEVVATWEPQRSTQETVATFSAFECIPGCVDPIAENYNPRANLDDDTCAYILGCTDDRALNYNPDATRNDGSCDFGGFGPINVTVFTDDSPADTTVRVVCDDAVALQMVGSPTWGMWSTFTRSSILEGGFTCEVFISDAVGDGMPGGAVRNCGEVVTSWTPQPAAGVDVEVAVGTFFTIACSGCDDEEATNFDPAAQISDGTCLYP